MNGHCCHAGVSLTRKARLREADQDGTDFAVAFVCQPCYAMLDTVDGVGLIDGKMYLLHDGDRFGCAPLYSTDMFDDYRRREALTLGAADVVSA